MKRLQANRLIINLKKCVFLSPSVDSLGYHLSPGGITMQIDKLHAVKDFPIPKNVKDVQRFLGICNYYKEFVKNLSELATPLFSLLRKENTFNWTIKGYCSKQALGVNQKDPQVPSQLFTEVAKINLEDISVDELFSLEFLKDKDQTTSSEMAVLLDPSKTKFTMIKDQKLFRIIKYLKNDYYVPYIPEISRLEKINS